MLPLRAGLVQGHSACDDVMMIYLRAAGCSVVLDVPEDADGTGRPPGLPRVVHWGADLGDLGVEDLAALRAATLPPVGVGEPDAGVPESLLPTAALGHPGTPGLDGHRAGRAWSPLFFLDAVDRPGGGRVVVRASDPAAGLTLVSELELTPSGLLRLRHRVGNAGADDYTVDRLVGVLPVPDRATELLDLTGRWCRERSPQRHPLPFGTWSREGRHGRTGHDATLGLLVGTPGFGFRHGEVWALHVAWSGNHATFAERLPSGRAVLGGGELLLPGEVVLAPGEEYATPWLNGAWSGRGMDGVSAAFHGWLRARPSHPANRHPGRPRPVVLNTWEAVYFDHDLDRLRRLADVAAGLGVERFVLDDGWFRHRRGDTAGLGDWYVDEQVWPDGLGPLVDHVRGLGMEFGLWVELEMVNEDSDLFRAHPEWVLAADGRLPPRWRHQQVLDLARPEAYAYVLGRLHALLAKYDIGYLKWDHNRDLVDAGHAGRAGVRAQTLAAYRLLDELRARHPDVEVESCSSGGGRVDLEILERTDRVWASDCNDALERQAIQRWTGLFLPPELVGAHVGPPTAHTTGRVLSLSFRAVTALFGHAGIEWDVAAADPAERAGLAEWIRLYRAERELLHTGDVVRVDHPDPSAWVHGIVAADRSSALFAYVQLATSAAEVPAAVRLPGLDPDRSYRLEPVSVAGLPWGLQKAAPPWYAAGSVVLPGRVLERVGVRLPVLNPEQALVLRATPLDLSG